MERCKLTVFWQRTMALEVLTLIEAASHSAANRPSVCWRSWSEANRTTSSAQSRDVSVDPKQGTLLTPAMPWYPVHEYHKRILERQGATVESNPHWKHVWMCAKSKDTAMALVPHTPSTPHRVPQRTCSPNMPLHVYCHQRPHNTEEAKRAMPAKTAQQCPDSSASQDRFYPHPAPLGGI